MGKYFKRSAIRTEKNEFGHPFSELKVGPIKESCKIGHAVAPFIRYLHSRGANNFKISIDDKTQILSIFTPDIGFSKEELEKETNSPIFQEVLSSLETIISN